jgi:hypothetical protein
MDDICGKTMHMEPMDRGFTILFSILHDKNQEQNKL